MSELSGGAIAGIVIGTFLTLSFIGAFIYFILLPICCPDNKQKGQGKQETTVRKNARTLTSNSSNFDNNNIYVYSVSTSSDFPPAPGGGAGEGPFNHLTDPGFSIPIPPDPDFSVPFSPDPGFSVSIDPDPGFSVSFDSGGGSFDSGGISSSSD